MYVQYHSNLYIQTHTHVRIRPICPTILLIILYCLVPVVFTHAQSVWAIEQGSDEVIYLPLDVHFPRTLGHLVITTPKIYDDVGLDASVGYDSKKISLWLTVYIYLQRYYSQRDLKSHFESLIGDIYAQWPDSKLVGAHNVTIPFKDSSSSGYMAFLSYAKGPTPGEWGGFAVLFPYGEFYFYIRVSFLGSDNETSIREAMGIIDSLLLALNLSNPEDIEQRQ